MSTICSKSSVRDTGDSGEGALVNELPQQADVRKARGHDCKGAPSRLHIESPNVCCLLVVCHGQGAWESEVNRTRGRV